MARYRLLEDIEYPAQVCTADQFTDFFTCPLHRLSAAFRVKFSSTGSLPTGLDGSTKYVINPSDAAFQVSATSGGAAIDLTSAGSGTLSFKRVVARVYDSQTGQEIVEDMLSPAWTDYLSWKSLNTPDPITPISISAVRTQAIAEVNRLAAEQRERWMPRDTGSSLWWTERLAEAKLADADGSIGAGAYPLLEAEVGLNGADVAAVADNVLTEWTTLRGKLAGIETARRDAVADINAAGTEAAIRAIPPAVTWPS